MVAKESLTELQDLYDPEDALSLCDLSTNTSDSSDDWDDRSSSNSDQDFFQFFSEDFTKSSTSFPAENIIFCGKLISLKPNKLPSNTKQSPEKKSLFRWKSDSYTKSKASRKCSEKYDFSVTSPVKSRWNSFMFGIVRFPTAEMEMRDMRMRQSRRRKSPASTVVAAAVNGGEMVMKNQSKGKGFWGILRDLGSKSQHADAKTSFGCIPL